MKVSFIFVNYKKSKQLHNIIQQLAKTLINEEYEIIVINNEFKDIHFDIQTVFVKNVGENIGYSKACNIGAKLATGAFLVFSNSDISITDNFKIELSNVLLNVRDKEIWGFAQNEPNGSLAEVARLFPYNIIQLIRHKLNNKKDIQKKNKPAPWVQSSFMIIRHDWFTSLNGFDDKYFVFMADIDICLRSWEKNGSVFYSDRITLFADGKRATSAKVLKFDFIDRIQRIHLFDAIKYFLCLNREKRRLMKQINNKYLLS